VGTLSTVGTASDVTGAALSLAADRVAGAVSARSMRTAIVAMVSRGTA
jgi:hypothetical protein